MSKKVATANVQPDLQDETKVVDFNRYPFNKQCLIIVVGSLTSNHVSSAQPALEIIFDFCVKPAGHFQEHGFDNSEDNSEKFGIFTSCLHWQLYGNCPTFI